MAKRQDFKETALVRTLAFVLGVRPDEYGLLPDDEGWVKTKDLIKAFAQEEGFKHVRESMVADIANRIAPDLIEIKDKLVRAVKREPLPIEWTDPPGELYIAVRSKSYPSVREKGLAPPPGIPAMLASDKPTALKLGRRNDQDPIMVTVAAGLAAGEGVLFRKFGEKIWLVDWLPAGCLSGPQVLEQPSAKQAAAQKAKPKKTQVVDRMPEPQAMPGGFYPTADQVEKPYKRKGIKKDIAWKKDRKKGLHQKGD